MSICADLNCPFCGSQNLKSDGDDKFVGVWCLDCQATGPNHYGRFDWNTRADTAAAQVAAAYERAADLCVDQFQAHLDLVITGNPDNARNRESAANMAEKLSHEIRAIATDTQTDALEQVRRDAERAGYERGVREAMDAALGDGEGEWFNHIQAIADLLDNPTPAPNEQTEAARELAFRKAVSS